NTVFLHGLVGILRARRLEPAAGRQVRGDRALVEAQHGKHNGFHCRASPWVASAAMGRVQPVVTGSPGAGGPPGCPGGTVQRVPLVKMRISASCAALRFGISSTVPRQM